MLYNLSIQPWALLLVWFFYLQNAVFCLAREFLSEMASGARVISADATGVLGVHALLQFGLARHLRDCAGA